MSAPKPATALTTEPLGAGVVADIERRRKAAAYDGLVSALRDSITSEGAMGMRDAGKYATRRMNAISATARALLAKLGEGV